MRSSIINHWIDGQESESRSQRTAPDYDPSFGTETKKIICSYRGILCARKSVLAKIVISDQGKVSPDILGRSQVIGVIQVMVALTLASHRINFLSQLSR